MADKTFFNEPRRREGREGRGKREEREEREESGLTTDAVRDIRLF
jgi:hypothetical protein